MPAHRLRPLRHLVLGLLLVAPPALAQNLDRFYLDLLQTGAQELDRGDAAAAARDLRLASFGLLDNPPTLAGCLVRLGIAQATLGDNAGFDESFRRLAEVEERFAGFSHTDLPAALRQRYVDEALQRVKEARLRTIPAFVPLLEAREESELARMSLRERRKAIEARLKADPASRRWQLALATLELEDEHPKAALKPLEDLLRSAPRDVQALCLRGRALAGTDDCAAAIESLRSCPLTEPPGVAAWLGCLLADHRDDAALQLARTLPPPTRSDPAVAKLLARLPAEPAPVAAKPAASPRADATSRATTTSSPPPATSAKPAASPPAAAPIAPPALPAGARAELDQVRRQMESARTEADLDAVWKAASGLADRFPASVEAQFLAAEVAYRGRHWTDAGRYFQRGGDPGEDRPLLLFYAAVVAHETGDAPRAQAALRRALPLIQRTPYVDLYVQKILRPPAGP